MRYLQSRGEVSPGYQISTEDQIELEKEFRHLEAQAAEPFVRYYRDHPYLLY